jgi:hypothetical protein
MRQAFADFEKQGGQLPAAVYPLWLILGNIRTDIPNIDMDRKVPWWHMVRMIWRGIGCGVHANHPAHAMRCRSQTVSDAYQAMTKIMHDGLVAGCNPELSWQDRALTFGSMLHTLQDSYCPAHARRLNPADATSPIIDMFTYPSRQHPFTTKRDAVWQDEAKTAFNPSAASAIQATVTALRIFSRQAVAEIDEFVERYLAFRADIRGH